MGGGNMGGGELDRGGGGGTPAKWNFYVYGPDPLNRSKAVVAALVKGRARFYMVVTQQDLGVLKTYVISTGRIEFLETAAPPWRYTTMSWGGGGPMGPI